MAFHWQAKGNTTSGVEDMVLLTKISDTQIVENLHKRYMNDLIYTYIGPVLIALNPYKSLPYFTQKEIEIYHGSSAHENPPHIYALAESMFQNMMIDEENQCVIISGESGAGKTESSKLLMNYIAAISGKGGSAVEETKRIILESNPFLEAFGNAKTLRNNNSSRFGKYFEICFTKGGQPIGGNISNFLLEKSRVVNIKQGERNFHIFYQLLSGADQNEKQQYCVAEPNYFYFLNQSSSFTVDGMDDAEEFQEVKRAMKVCGVSDSDRNSLFSIIAGILHLGNISFSEKPGGGSYIKDENLLEYPSFLLGLDANELKNKLLSRLMVTGGAGQRSSAINLNLNVQQATNTRDALAKALYTRIFDWIIGAVNKAIKKNSSERILNLGVLDIYGFEIFEKNGFEQLCINYVNEKLQQVFIELTLKSEQEEYVREGINWTPISYFNNKVVCDLIEGKKPSGVMAILDDICVQLHGETSGADAKFVQKLDMGIQNPHYNGRGSFFTIKHYAGQVEYNSDGFCEANKDTLFKDLIQLAQSSKTSFIRNLFPEDVSVDDKKRPTTASFKIRNQCNLLVDTLMKCTPSYIRCIKPNEQKKPREWDGQRVEHQVKYLNLRENINIRRAGYCYRNFYDKFLKRYAILTPETFPQWRGNSKDGVSHIMSKVNMDPGQWQLGLSKVFVKAPESLFMLEELRERKFHEIVRKIQRCYRKWKSRKYYLECQKKVRSVVFGKKERKRMSLNREFFGDYLDTLNNPVLRNFAGRQEKILFADRVKKYDRRWKMQIWEMIVTEKQILFIGEEVVKEGPEKGLLKKVCKRSLNFNQVKAISLSTKCDDFFIIHVPDEYDNVFENFRKTEFLMVFCTAYEKATGRILNVFFSDTAQYTVKKTRWDRQGSRTLNFRLDISLDEVKVLVNNSSRTDIAVPGGLPKDSQPQVQSGPVTNKFSNPSSSNYPLKKNNVSSSNPPRPANNNMVRPPMPVAPTLPQNRNSFSRSSSSPNISSQKDEARKVPVNPNFNQPNVQQSNLSNSLSHQNLATKKVPPPPKIKVEQVRAIYSYEAREADELTFNAGDLITIIYKDNQGWWTGVSKGKKGLLPTNYVEPA